MALYQAVQQPFCGPFVPFRLEYFVQHSPMLIDLTIRLPRFSSVLPS